MKVKDLEDFVAKLKVMNFGPINKGFQENNGFMEITPVTVFCGNQATGKSTIAKLYSTFVWLEKAFARLDYKIESFSIKDFLSILENQKMSDYFSQNTYLEYDGVLYNFKYDKNKVEIKSYVEKRQMPEYFRPKIMYVPSERNLLSVLEDVENIKKLPLMLSLLLEEYNNAKKKSITGIFELPVSDVKIKYDKDKLTTYVLTKNGILNIAYSSSGIQSVFPLSAVTRYLTENTLAENKTDLRTLSYQERERIKDWIINSSDMPKNMADTFDRIFLTNSDNPIIESPFFSKFLFNYFNRCFINIVEEPELNLFPDSQSKVLYELLECKNVNLNNQLVFTTHSPYLLSYLTLCIKASELKENGVPLDMLNNIIPIKSAIKQNTVSIYQTNQDGTVSCLQPYNNLPSDRNFLNIALEETNEKFAQLLEMEDEFCSR